MTNYRNSLAAEISLGDIAQRYNRTILEAANRVVENKGGDDAIYSLIGSYVAAHLTRRGLLDENYANGLVPVVLEAFEKHPLSLYMWLDNAQQAIEELRKAAQHRDAEARIPQKKTDISRRTGINRKAPSNRKARAA